MRHFKVSHHIIGKWQLFKNILTTEEKEKVLPFKYFVNFIVSKITMVAFLS